MFQGIRFVAASSRFSSDKRAVLSSGRVSELSSTSPYTFVFVRMRGVEDSRRNRNLVSWRTTIETVTDRKLTKSRITYV